MVQDFYGVLGVQRSASADEIKDAYRKIARDSHTDGKNPNDTIFMEATRAYEVLHDETTRMAYDQVDPGVASEHMYDVNFTKDLKDSYVNQTEAVETTDLAVAKQRETRTEHNTGFSENTTETKAKTNRGPGWETTGFDFFDYFSGTNESDTTVTGFANRQSQGKEFNFSGLFNEPQIEQVYTFGDLVIAEPELNLMAGCVEAIARGEGTTIDCGDYKVTMREGKLDVEVRLGRLTKIEGAKETKVCVLDKNGIPRYDVAGDDKFVSIGELTKPMMVTGVVVPFNLEGYVGKLAEMAGNVYRNEKIDGSDVVALGVEGSMCYPNSERGSIKASDLAAELGRRSSLSAPEGSFFNSGKKVEGIKVDFGMNRGRKI